MNRIEAFGDRLGDGRIQVSFTLSNLCGGHPSEVARRFVLALGLDGPEIAHTKDLGDGFYFFVVYARTSVSLEPLPGSNASLVERWPREQIEAKVARRARGPFVVVGACTGSDAHTVGLDAILSRKGFCGDPGLESYSAFRVVNLGAQVANATLIDTALREKADAILVSQIVTQSDIHRQNLKDLATSVRASDLRDNVLLVVGGPRITPDLAAELGFDAGFGVGTTPAEVANNLVQSLLARERSERGRIS